MQSGVSAGFSAEELITGLPGMWLVLGGAPGFRILGASNDYLNVTGTTRFQLVGQSVLGARPHHPLSLRGRDTAALRRSLERVQATRNRDIISVSEDCRFLARTPEIARPAQSAWRASSTPLISRSGELLAISNLVTNALKFTPAGGHVTVAAKQDGGEVQFSVADNGAGIPLDQQRHLFHRFWQASATDLRGVGLGLAIVKGIVEAHGGTIRVESTVGKGTRFELTLPREPARNG